MHTVFFETFGCQMNVADSTSLADILAQKGYGVVESADKAELVIVNTCSVRDHAEARAKIRIAELSLRKNKKKKPQAIWVVGCMAQRLGEELKAELPGVDRVVGAIDLETLSQRIDDYLQSVDADAAVEPRGPGISVYVPIMRGCDNYCSYCIVPYVRGGEHSLKSATIKSRIEHLVDRGAREVTLLGQNVNSYRDPDSGAAFPDLLSAIHDISGLLRIRFTTSHPKDCSATLIRTVAELPKVCKHLHLPVQSGSTRILGLMERGYTRDNYRRLIDDIRISVPGIDITTNIMTGFPTESEADFQDTLSLVRDVRFTAAFMFHFSPRPLTKAASMEGAIDPSTAKARLRELIDLQTGITKEHYHSMVGKTIDVLFTEKQEKSDRGWMGQDAGCKRVLFACSDDLAGTILPMKIKVTTGMTLVAEKAV